jgi:transcriptional regulator with XRE-family HTH domain
MIAKNLKLLRTQKGLTQKELSILSGSTVPTISRAENGGSISENTLATFAKVLKVSVKKLKGE